MRAYSNDLRERVFRAVSAGEPVKSVAKLFEVGVCWVYKILARYRQTGSYEALPYNNGAPRKLSEGDLHLLSELVQKYPDATLQELKEKGNFEVSVSTIHRALHNQLKITYKKKRFTPVSKAVQTCKKHDRSGKKRAKNGMLPG